MIVATRPNPTVLPPSRLTDGIYSENSGISGSAEDGPAFSTEIYGSVIEKVFT